MDGIEFRCVCVCEYVCVKMIWKHDVLVNYETFIYSFIYFTFVYFINLYERYKHKHRSVPSLVLIVHMLYTINNYSKGYNMSHNYGTFSKLIHLHLTFY